MLWPLMSGTQTVTSISIWLHPYTCHALICTPTRSLSFFLAPPVCLSLIHTHSSNHVYMHESGVHFLCDFLVDSQVWLWIKEFQHELDSPFLWDLAADGDTSQCRSIRNMIWTLSRVESPHNFELNYKCQLFLQRRVTPTWGVHFSMVFMARHEAWQLQVKDRISLKCDGWLRHSENALQSCTIAQCNVLCKLAGSLFLL